LGAEYTVSCHLPARNGRKVKLSAARVVAWLPIFAFPQAKAAGMVWADCL